jgi:hypothetical protein
VLLAQLLRLKSAWSLIDVFTIVYTVADDSYKKLFGIPAYFRISLNDHPIFSNSEVTSIVN